MADLVDDKEILAVVDNVFSMEALTVSLKVRFRLSCDKASTEAEAIKLISGQSNEGKVYKLIIVQITEDEENPKAESLLCRRLMDAVSKQCKKTLIMVTNQNETKQGNQIIENPDFEQKLKNNLEKAKLI